MRPGLVGLVLLSTLLGASCERGRTDIRHPPHPAAALTVPSTSSPTAAAAPPIATEPLAPPPPAVTFSEGRSVHFRAGPALRIKPLAMQAEFHALSPDAKSWVVRDWFAPRAKLVTPSSPKGVTFEGEPQGAMFSADGRRVVIWNDRLLVLDVGTGKTLLERDATICAARFSGPDTIVYQIASEEPDARLWHQTISTGKASPLGPAHKAEHCEASLDGRLWLISGYDQNFFVDGINGRVQSIQTSVHLARGATRWCSADETGMRCVRVPDGREENVWRLPTVNDFTFSFDPEGQFALIQYAPDRNAVMDKWALVDFAAQIVHRLEAIRPRAGSLFQMHQGGKLITIGSSSGAYVYDVERASVRFAPHRPLYGTYSLAHHSRRLVASTDEPTDVYLIDVP